jgi:hypothetical protein
LAPELEPYFVTGHHDDHASILQSYGLGYRPSLSGVLGGTPALVGAINVVVVGVIGALIAEVLGARGTANLVGRSVACSTVTPRPNALCCASDSATSRPPAQCDPLSSRRSTTISGSALAV